MSMVQFDKHTLDLIECLVKEIKEMNNRLESMGDVIDNIESKLDDIDSNTSYLEYIESNDGKFRKHIRRKMIWIGTIR